MSEVQHNGEVTQDDSALTGFNVSREEVQAALIGAATKNVKPDNIVHRVSKSAVNSEDIKDKIQSKMSSVYHLAAKAICQYSALQCHKWSRRSLSFTFGVASGLVSLALAPAASVVAIPAVILLADVFNEKFQPGVKLRNWACSVTNKNEGTDIYKPQKLVQKCEIA